MQRHIRAAVDACAPGPIRVVSICAGQGHDLIGALDGHPRAADVRARLVELDPRNCDAARAAAPPGVEVVAGDASDTSAYAGAVPAELVLAYGVFGNISDDDIARTIETLPSLCAPGATVIWTRHRRPPDRTDDIRRWFVDAGFDEVAFEGPDGFVFGVGVNRLDPTARPVRARREDVRLRRLRPELDQRPTGVSYATHIAAQLTPVRAVQATSGTWGWAWCTDQVR